MYSFPNVCLFKHSVDYQELLGKVWCGLEQISFWHCWGVNEGQVALKAVFGSSVFLGHLFLICLDNTWFKSGKLAG